MTDLQGENNNLEEEDEELKLKRIVDEAKKRFEGMKFDIKEHTSKNNELLKQIGVLDRSLLDLEKQICQIDKSIKILDDKIIQRQRNKKFIDVLREDADINMYGNLTYFSFMSSDTVSKEYIKGYETLKGKSFMMTEKFKLMKYLGQLCSSFDSIFEIDHITFGYTQYQLSKLYNSNVEGEENSYFKISRNITVKTYNPNFKDIHFEKMQYEVTERDKCYNVSILEYDDFFNITQKLYVIEIKMIACRYWQLHHENYLMCDENLRIYPCDLVVYDEIFQMNLDNNLIKSHCHFYQLNPKIIEKYKLLLIHKAEALKMVSINEKNFNFVDNSVFSRSCKFFTKTAKIVSFIKTKHEQILADYPLNKKLESFRKNYKDDILRAIIQRQLKGILKEMYPNINKIVNDRKNLNQEEEKSGDAPKINNQLKTLESQSSNKKKKPQKRRIAASNIDAFEEKYFLEKQENLKKELYYKHFDIFQNFNMNFEVFVSYCDGILQNVLFKSDKTPEDKIEKEEIKEDNKKDDELYEMIISNLNNPEASIYEDKRLLKDFYENDREFYQKEIVDCYVEKEREFLTEIESQIKIPLKSEISVANSEYEEDDEIVPENKEISIPTWLRFFEFLIICVYLITSYFYINQIPINFTSYFNNMITEVFNEKENCVGYFTNIITTNDANKWLLNCYLNIIENWILTDEQISNDPSLSFYIHKAEIQLQDYNTTACSGGELLNLTLSKNSKCQTENRFPLSIRKKYFSSNFNIRILEDPRLANNITLGSFDYLMFSSVNLDAASAILIDDVSDVKNLKNLLTVSYKLKAMSIGQNTDYLYTTKTQKKVETIMDEISTSSEKSGASYDIIDPNTRNVNAIVYFLSVLNNPQDEQYLGIIVFNLKQNIDGTTETSINNYSVRINNIAAQGSFSAAEIINLLSVFGLLASFYLKYGLIRNVEETLERSIFFLVFFASLIFEYVYKTNLIIKGIFNYRDINDINKYKYDITVFSIENIKLIKSFGIIFICYHMIFVVFNKDHLIVFNIFLKPVFQRFLIVVYVLVLCFSIIVFFVSGPYTSYNKTLSSTFLTIFENSLGIYPPEDDSSPFARSYRDLTFILKVIIFFINLFTNNFSLVIIFFLYRKYTNRRQEKEAMEN